MEYSEHYIGEVLLKCEAMFASIEEQGREPTPWEAKCLFSALAAIASDSWGLAQEHIDKCRAAEHPPAQSSEMTIEGLRNALAQLRSTKT